MPAAAPKLEPPRKSRRYRLPLGGVADAKPLLAGGDIMNRHRPPGTVVVTCPVPSQAAPRDLVAWLRRAEDTRVTVTWVAPAAGLETVRAALDGAASSTRATADAAVALEPAWFSSKTSLRQAVRRARDAWPDLAAAVLHGRTPLEHRDVLAQEGIGAVCVEGFAPSPRGSRRPAPHGWPCRSVLWGIWEIDSARPARGAIGSWSGWWGRTSATHGSLTILHAGTGGESTAAIRARLDRHVGWAARRVHAGMMQSIGLGELPAVIAGGGIAATRGSVLRAA